MTISLSTIMRGFGSADWPSPSLINTFQADSRCHADLVHFYVGWETPFSDLQSSLAAVDANHSTALITWQPDGINTTQIANHTTYITQFADAVKAYGRPIFIRPMHEMNGNGSVRTRTPSWQKLTLLVCSFHYFDGMRNVD